MDDRRDDPGGRRAASDLRRRAAATRWQARGTAGSSAWSRSGIAAQPSTPPGRRRPDAESRCASRPRRNVRPSRSASVRTAANPTAVSSGDGAAAVEELRVDRSREQPAEARRAPPSRSPGSVRRAAARACASATIDARLLRPAVLPARRAARRRRRRARRTAARSTASRSLSTSAPSRSTLRGCARDRAGSLSTAQARPVRPALIASAAISAGSLQPTISTRSPSLMPGHRDGERLARAFFQPGHDVSADGAARGLAPAA